MTNEFAAQSALKAHVERGRERGRRITEEQHDRASTLLHEILPLAERHGVTDYGVNLHLARAVLDAILAPPPKPPRKARLRARREGVNR